ncbi:MAG: amidase, partial [Chitinispirillia bacterium]
SQRVQKSIEETSGIFLVSKERICDARFSKSCGGITELYSNTWDNEKISYLSSVPDSKNSDYSIKSETDARNWILSKPEAYCNNSDAGILQTILPDFDQETGDFYRWKVSYKRDELERLLYRKSGFDFGKIRAIEPLERGPSGRITRLKISGTKRTVIVGKELEIRRWLAQSHLYSSAFIISTSGKERGLPLTFTFHGAGWGHGVGLCQIGAAVMAIKRISYEEILRHYFRGVQMVKLY